MPKAKAFRVPTVPRTRLQIAERPPITPKRELELLRRFFFCGSCNALLTARGDYVYDHLIALELGGKDDAANIRPLCLRCNAIKTALDQKLIAKAKWLAGEIRRPQQRRPLPFGRSDKYKRTVDGRRVLRKQAPGRTHNLTPLERPHPAMLSSRAWDAGAAEGASLRRFLMRFRHELVDRHAWVDPDDA